jgi:hypothetical protein
MRAPLNFLMCAGIANDAPTHGTPATRRKAVFTFAGVAPCPYPEPSVVGLPKDDTRHS